MFNTDDNEKKDVSSPPDDADDILIPEGVETILEGLPKDAKKRVEKLVVQEFGMMGIGRRSQENEIAKKINEEHITNYLNGAKEQMHNDFRERHERKIFTIVLVSLALIFILLVIILLKENTAVLEKIIYSITGLVAGAFGGYGFGRRTNQDDD